ncbi:class I SAM-dependent methyltransferase [Streptomyces sp. NPDC088097]|uniref:class I SAM-dependent methyltransferase n=1 Tax=Streptomyces sp. NPDC088097 TaxID=3365823 RepID=UPI00380322A7
MGAQTPTPGGTSPEPAASGGPSTPGGYGTRVFRPEQLGEDERIDLGALTYDDTTLARLRALGAGPGWHCLELGAGTGSVARRLLRDAGVSSVLAVDRDVRFLAARPEPGLTTLEADIADPAFGTTGDGFPEVGPGRFHLVHARFVLMHLPARQRVISRLAELLVPGGVLVLGDAIDLTGATTPKTAYGRTMAAMWQGLRDTIGTDVSWTPRYPELLSAAGLVSVAADVHVPPLVPGSPISRFWAETWERSRPAMTATDLVDDAVVDEAVRFLDSPDCAALSPGMITAWGRRREEPGGPPA